MTENDILLDEQTLRESNIQHTCVVWFRRTFPAMAGLLFAVPNGGFRTKKTAAVMMYEGQVSGVSDLILLCPSGGKGALCIEMKTPKRKGSSAGKQSDRQKAWQALVEANGYAYRVCHGLVEFVTAVCDYLGEDTASHIAKATNNYPLYR